MTASTKTRTLAEEMALAVLRGETASAEALADLLLENRRDGAVQVAPVRVLPADIGRLRVLLFCRDGAELHDTDIAATREAVHNWLHHGDALVLAGMERVEIYQLEAPT